MPHQRKKSGGALSTDVRKSVSVTDMTKYKRPGLSRKHTPVTLSAQKLGRSQREREREWQDTLLDERDSFPQYCMICEKQFQAYDDKHLYCSDACRRVDQSLDTKSTMPRSYGSANYPFYSAGEPEHKDIIPQASPSRPTSMYFSNSPPTPPGTTSHAVSALRSLSIGGRPPSPPSDSGANFWPFGGGSNRTSPSTSYTRPAYFSSTFDNGYAGYYDLSSGRMDRPLPPSRNPSHVRPQSVELVTPMVRGR